MISKIIADGYELRISTDGVELCKSVYDTDYDERRERWYFEHVKYFDMPLDIALQEIDKYLWRNL